METVLLTFSINYLKILKLHQHLLFAMKTICKMEQILNHVSLISILWSLLNQSNL